MLKTIPLVQNAAPRALLGVRTSLGEVVAVVAGAGVGALIDGHLYGDGSTLGAIGGLLLGKSVAVASRRMKQPVHTTE